MRYLRHYNTIIERTDEKDDLYLPYLTYTEEDDKLTNDGNYINDFLYVLDAYSTGNSMYDYSLSVSQQSKFYYWSTIINDFDVTKSSGIIPLTFTKNGSVSYGISDTPPYVPYISISNGGTYRYGATKVLGYPTLGGNDLSMSYRECTIEVCYYTDLLGTGGIIFDTTKAENIAFGLLNSTTLIWASTSIDTWKTSSSFYGTHTISCNADRALMDGNIELTAGSANYWSPSSEWIGIGGRSQGTYPFTGKIYSIRIYPRKLSYDEMRHNQYVDKKRFALEF